MEGCQMFMFDDDWFYCGTDLVRQCKGNYNFSIDVTEFETYCTDSNDDKNAKIVGISLVLFFQVVLFYICCGYFGCRPNLFFKHHELRYGCDCYKCSRGNNKKKSRQVVPSIEIITQT